MPYPKRLLFVIGSLESGGTEVHLSRMLPRLDRAQFAPIVFTLARRGALAKQLESQGVPVIAPLIRSRGDRWPLALRMLRLAIITLQFTGHLLRWRPDLVHFFLPEAYLLAAPPAILLGVRPRVMSRRSLNDYQRDRPAFVNAMERWLHRRMDAVLCNSRHVLAQLRDEEGMPTARSVLLYNGIPVDIQPDRGAARAALKLSDDLVAMIIVANLIPYKGHDDLLRACGALEPSDNWTLLVVGEDPGGRQAALRHLAAELGIAERVRFLGARTDVTTVLAASDIGILASHEEGFSNAILEGMATALPMVVTDVGGNSEAVLDGTTGLVVPRHDPPALAAALKRLIENHELRRRYGEAGRRRVVEHFSLARCVDEYERLYEALLRKH